MKRVITTLLIFASLGASASEIDCSQLGRSLTNLGLTIKEQSRIISDAKELLAQAEVELLAADPSDDSFDAIVAKYDQLFIQLANEEFEKKDFDRRFIFWKGKYLIECNPSFNKQDYPGPPKRRMRNIG